MRIYIDGDYRCQAQPGEETAEAEHAFFDGKCEAFIGAYRYVPAGHTWKRADGAVFMGEMIAPHTDPSAALAAQAEYESIQANAADYAAAYNEGVQSA